MGCNDKCQLKLIQKDFLNLALLKQNKFIKSPMFTRYNEFDSILMSLQKVIEKSSDKI